MRSRSISTVTSSDFFSWQLGNLWNILATGVQTDNAFTLLDQVVHDGGGGGPVTHSHTQEEGLYIISGQCTFNAGGQHGLIAPAGTFVAVPGSTEHSFTVDLPNTHMLNFYLPAGFEQLLIGIAHPANERKPPPREKIMEMMPPPWLADKLSQDYGQTSVLGNPFVDKPDPAKMFTKATPGATLFPYTVNADNLPCYTTSGGCWTILADGKQTGGSYCLFEVRSRKGIMTPPRTYADRDEVLYVFHGSMSVFVGGRMKKVSKGGMVFIPSGTIFSARVDSDDTHYLNLHTRSGFEELIRLCGVESEGLARKAPSPGFVDKGVDIGTRKRLARKIGVTFVPIEVPWDNI